MVPAAGQWLMSFLLPTRQIWNRQHFGCCLKVRSIIFVVYLRQCVASRQHLHSASRRLLVVPCHRRSSYSRWAFSVAGPAIWNWLPECLRDPVISRDSFKCSLKTFYQTVWEIRPSAETPSGFHWRRFYFQLTRAHSVLELSGRCTLQIYLLIYFVISVKQSFNRLNWYRPKGQKIFRFICVTVSQNVLTVSLCIWLCLSMFGFSRLLTFVFIHCMQVDLPVTSPRFSRIEFQFFPELGDHKMINGDRYLNPWINYTLPNPVLVGFTLCFWTPFGSLGAAYNAMFVLGLLESSWWTAHLC